MILFRFIFPRDEIEKGSTGVGVLVLLSLDEVELVLLVVGC